MEGNIHIPNYDSCRRMETPHLDDKGFPPKNYLASSITGELYCHEAKQYQPEPGCMLTCQDCPGKKFETMDHFKYYCAGWKGRVRLQKGFCWLHNKGMHQGPFHLNNEAINAMIAQGVTMARVNKQPKSWLPNEPLYDFDPISNLWCSTNIVPVDVWMGLPTEMRLEPMPQDNTLEARQTTQMLLPQGNLAGLANLNSPRAIDERNFLRDLANYRTGVEEVRDDILPGYTAFMQEYEEQKLRIERLESQIASAKLVMNSLNNVYGANPLALLVNFPQAMLLFNDCFDQPGIPGHIPPAVHYVQAVLGVPPRPDSAVKQTADANINYLNSL